MREMTSTLITEAVFSDDGTKRYLLKKTWNITKPKLTIVMLAPSQASEVSMDTTTQLVVNNASRLGYGSVAIVNLFATLNDFLLKQAEEEDPENMDAIIQEMQDADQVVYAPGTGKAKNKVFQKRQEQVLLALKPYEDRLRCLCDKDGGSRYLHPLSPRVREWHLALLKISELIEVATEDPPKEKKGKRGKKENHEK